MLNLLVHVSKKVLFCRKDSNIFYTQTLRIPLISPNLLYLLVILETVGVSLLMISYVKDLLPIHQGLSSEGHLIRPEQPFALILYLRRSSAG